MKRPRRAVRTRRPPRRVAFAARVLRPSTAVPLVAAAAFGAALVGLVDPRGAVAYVDGPPLAHTGGFGEPTCRACHFDAELNEAPGGLVLKGLPAAYEPGERYRFTVALSRAGMGRAGFQLAARFAGGGDAGEQAGELRAVNGDRVEVVRHEASGVLYARHREAGTEPITPDSTRWRLDWTAPAAAAGDVVFHVTANAANDDASEFGDFIYATSRTLR